MHKKTTLDNGIRLITATMPHTRSVSISFFIGAGSRYETEQEAGISHFIEHLLFRGTQKRATARQISEAIEGVGGILNGGTDRELTVYWCKVAQTHLPIALDVLVDILLHSKFDPADIEKERPVIVEEINMSKDSPAQQVNMLIDKLLWPNHPLGRDIAGTKESVAAVTKDMMLEYLSHKYLPSNTVISIAENIQHQQMVTAVSQAMGNWSSQQPNPGYSAYMEQPNPRLHIETRDIEQAHMCMALPGLPLLHPKCALVSLSLIKVSHGRLRV